MLFTAALLLLAAMVSADPFIYNVYSSSGSQSPYANPYTRSDEIYIRRPEMRANPYYSGMGNQATVVRGGTGGLQGLQGIPGMQSSIQTMQGFGIQPFDMSSTMMGVGSSYGSSSYYNKPRFAASDMMMMGGGAGAGQPLILNGYPMYPRTSGYPMMIPLGMSSFGSSSPTFYQGPTVSRLPFQAAAKRARFYY